MRPLFVSLLLLACLVDEHRFFVMSLTASPCIRIPRMVMVDRDGVVNEDVGAPGVLRVSDFCLTPNAGISIGNLKRAGCIVVVVTNQSCVGKGLVDEQKLLKIHTYMSALLVEQDEDAVLDKIYVCTSTKEQNDPNMKPNPGMIVQACRDFGVSSEDCVFIGDTITDLEAATAAKVPLKVLVSTGYGRSIIGRDAQECAEIIERSSFPAPITPFYYTINLASAVDLLLSMETNALSK